MYIQNEYPKHHKKKKQQVENDHHKSNARDQRMAEKKELQSNRNLLRSSKAIRIQQEEKVEMDNMQKGKTGEKIVEDMFKEAGFKVIKSGYENKYRDLADRNNLLRGPAAKYIRHHPDLIVVDKSNNAYLIEVKYRKFGLIHQKDLFNYPETQVILLTKDSIHCQHLKEIHKNGRKFVPLTSMKPFSEIPPEIIQKYILKTRRLLGDENLIGQLIEKMSQRIVGKPFEQPYTPGDVKFSYIENYNKEGDSYEVSDNKEIISGRGGRIVSSRHGKSWKNQEVSTLKSYYASRMSIDEIATNLGRKKDAVIFKLVNVGAIQMYQAKNLLGKSEVPRIHKPRRSRHILRTSRKIHSKRRQGNNPGKIRIHKIIRRKRR